MKHSLKGSFFFTLFIFALLLLFFFIAFGYDEKDRAVPLVLLTAGLIMTVFCLIGEFFPNLLKATNISLISLRQEIIQDDHPTSRVSKLHGKKGPLLTIGWLVGFSFLTLLVGFLIAIPAALLVFLKYFAVQNWLRSLGITSIAWLIVYGVFDVLMGFELFKGILFGGILIL